MNLQPLTNNGEVSTKEFAQLFEARLGDLFEQAMGAFATLGAYHSFSVANCIHLGLQKGNIEKVVTGLVKWCDIYRLIPNPVLAGVETRQFFDILYTECFFGDGDSVGGVGPLVKTGESETSRFATFGVDPASTAPKLWVPGQ